MKPIRRLSLILWFMLKDLPPPSLGRLLMPSVFLVGWTGLLAFGMPPGQAFVCAALMAQIAQIWAVLPKTVARQRRQFGRARVGVIPAACGIFCVLAVQVWWMDPLISQRLLSGYGLLYAAIMAWGVWGDSDIRDRFAPVHAGADVPIAFRVHLLKLYALVALIVVAINESLLATAAPLGMRVVVLSVLPLVLHFFFAITLRLTAPPLTEKGR